MTIVQKAGCSSRLDELDAALRNGLSEKRTAMPRRVAGLFPSADRCKTARPMEIDGRLSLRVKGWPVARSGATDA
jgi:hypothetical protein